MLHTVDESCGESLEKTWTFSDPFSVIIIPYNEGKREDCQVNLVNALPSEQLWLSNMSTDMHRSGETAPHLRYFFPNMYIAFLIEGIAKPTAEDSPGKGMRAALMHVRLR